MSTSGLVPTVISSQNPGINYTPTDSWHLLDVNGSTNGGSEFDLGDSLHGYCDAFVTFTFTQPAQAFEYWGYQRSDGGLYSICFDCSPTATNGQTIDALNRSTNGQEAPRLLYQNYTLTYAMHNVTIANLFDSRATIGGATNGSCGQMTMDRFVLYAPTVLPTTAATSSSTTSISSSSSSSSASPSATAAASSSSNTGAIAGGVVGGLAALAALAVLLLFCLRRNKANHRANRHTQDLTETPEYKDDPANAPVTPFVLQSDAASTHGSMRSPPGQSTGYTNYAPSLSQNQWGHVGRGTASSGPSTSSGGGQRSPPVNPNSAFALQPMGGGKGARNPEPVTRPSERNTTTAPTSPSVYPNSSTAEDTTTPHDRDREQDAGWLDGEEEELGTLPPDYDAATAARRAARV